MSGSRFYSVKSDQRVSNIRCTLFIHRLNGYGFIVYFPNVTAAWNAVLSILKQIELIEGDEATVSTVWNYETGVCMASLPLSNYTHTKVDLLWSSGHKHIEYIAGCGNSYQLILIKGYGTSVYQDKNDKVILMSLEQALYYLNNEEISVSQTTSPSIMKLL
jgi:hypothetical protein